MTNGVPPLAGLPIRLMPAHAGGFAIHPIARVMANGNKSPCAALALGAWIKNQGFTVLHSNNTGGIAPTLTIRPRNVATAKHLLLAIKASATSNSVQMSGALFMDMFLDMAIAK